MFIQTSETQQMWADLRCLQLFSSISCPWGGACSFYLLLLDPAPNISPRWGNLHVTLQESVGGPSYSLSSFTDIKKGPSTLFWIHFSSTSSQSHGLKNSLDPRVTSLPVLEFSTLSTSLCNFMRRAEMHSHLAKHSPFCLDSQHPDRSRETEGKTMS